ncbi:hypothetical protein MMPV_002570 [Pyropia vietnamensis]
MGPGEGAPEVIQAELVTSAQAGKGAAMAANYSRRDGKTFHPVVVVVALEGATTVVVASSASRLRDDDPAAPAAPVATAARGNRDAPAPMVVLPMAATASQPMDTAVASPLVDGADATAKGSLPQQP